MVWSSASTTRTRVKSEGCGSGVAVASDIVGSWRPKVIGALNSLTGGLTGRALAKRYDICRNLIRVWVQKYEAIPLLDGQSLTKRQFLSIICIQTSDV
jgi:hypothetical protein